MIDFLSDPMEARKLLGEEYVQLKEYVESVVETTATLLDYNIESAYSTYNNIFCCCFLKRDNTSKRFSIAIDLENKIDKKPGLLVTSSTFERKYLKDESLSEKLELLYNLTSSF